MRFDATGKVSLEHIYTQPDPRSYFGALRKLDYCVPQLGKPYFAKLIDELRTARRTAVPQVLDIGCSYGVNAALLKYDLTMDDLYARYGDARAAEADAEAAPAIGTADRDALLARDRDLARTRDTAPRMRFVGLDTSGPALDYALEAGFLDDAVHADLESHDLTPDESRRIAGTDLVISTGCLGYVTEKTLTRIVRSLGDRRPWMAHFVLRMFPFDPVEQALADLGYRTVRVEGVFRQRRFASAEEQAGVLRTMAAAGVDARGLEEDGWFHARLFLSLPADASGSRPAEDLAAGVQATARPHDHDRNREQS
ncbi:class I SAM-dependent methyltransferase [Streptomyces meridianus]|uniref:Class I SAM-dependent methyltransferase n=1 Tax=Streptomyces meridianus TaxID=2938945 RepID=A0ABT0XC17_9ACTN|nr:class I SAM-dependent methyltransferase [Streptomyces meridianus]MCM2580063.1 class I SAM-dependent methyltransferase [Streptomyces meridianus]